MIKFFRKIRQKMLTENKFSKYLLYAIGEIILVVIGILIALSINNWNNQKIRSNEEVSLLQDMVVDLNQNIDVNNNVLKIHDYALNRNITLYQVLLKKTVDYDSTHLLIKSLISSATPTYSTSAYQTISQIGLNIIENDSLRKSIIRYYENVIPYANAKANLDPKFQFQTLLKPYYNKYFKIKLNSNDSIINTINNSDKMLDDNEFINELNTAIEFRKILMTIHKRDIKKAESLTKLINKYVIQND